MVRRRAILSIDGGGARGVLALEILVHLEAELARVRNDANARLADHFDLVAGTSVGAVYASLIALGVATVDIRDYTLRTLQATFKRSRWRDRLYFRYEKSSLESNIKQMIGADTLLGSSKLRTLLMLVLSNATTNSPWIVSNHPQAPFNLPSQDDCNLNLPLWQLVRASAAAPSYFAPEVISMGRERPYPFMFVDGGLTGYNNPAFKAFLFATTQPYGVNWLAREQGLTVVSVGTGELRERPLPLDPKQMNLLRLAAKVPETLMASTAREQDLLCRTFGRCLLGDAIDSEVGDLRISATALEPRLFTYYRLNPTFSRQGLGELGFAQFDPLELFRLDGIEHAPQLRQIGAAVARRGVSPELLARLIQREFEA